MPDGVIDQLFSNALPPDIPFNNKVFNSGTAPDRRLKKNQRQSP